MLPPRIGIIETMWLRICSIYARLKLMAVIFAIISISAMYRNQSTSNLKNGARFFNDVLWDLGTFPNVSFTRYIVRL